MTTLEARKIALTIAPLLKQGLSPYRILQIHPELGISEKTLYNYIEQDIFHEIADVTVMDLRRQVSRRISKKKSVVYKKRADSKYLTGRTYKDYKEKLLKTVLNEQESFTVILCSQGKKVLLRINT